MILPLEKQVCRLDLSRKLRELGVPQESLVFWCETADSSSRGNFLCSKGETVNALVKGFYSAYTASELDDILSKVEYESAGFPAYMIWFTMGNWHVLFRNPSLSWINKKSQDAGVDKNPVDARAKMLIYLLEKGLVTL